MKEVSMRAWDDWHLHARQDEMMKNVLPYTFEFCGRALLMPNTEPCIATAEDVTAYRLRAREIHRDYLVRPSGARLSHFEPVMSIKLLSRTPGSFWRTTPESIRAAFAAGAIVGKLYPTGKGGTTGATTEGVDLDNLEELYPSFAEMQELGMVLAIHGQVPSAFLWEREPAFLTHATKLRRDFPRLRIVLEHVSTRAGVEWVELGGEYTAGTITGHHLMFTADDSDLRIYHQCMPNIGTPADRQALLSVVMRGHHRFFFGSDSAPHLWLKKTMVGKAPAGVFSAPVVAQLLLEYFEKMCGDIHQAVRILESFTSKFGADFYRMKYNVEAVTFCRQMWKIPADYNGVVPMSAGEEAGWQLAGQV